MYYLKLYAIFKKNMQSWLESHPLTTTEQLPIGRKEESGTEVRGYRIWPKSTIKQPFHGPIASVELWEL